MIEILETKMDGNRKCKSGFDTTCNGEKSIKLVSIFIDLMCDKTHISWLENRLQMVVGSEW